MTSECILTKKACLYTKNIIRFASPVCIWQELKKQKLHPFGVLRFSMLNILVWALRLLWPLLDEKQTDWGGAAYCSLSWRRMWHFKAPEDNEVIHSSPTQTISYFWPSTFIQHRLATRGKVHYKLTAMWVNVRSCRCHEVRAKIGGKTW